MENNGSQGTDEGGLILVLRYSSWFCPSKNMLKWSRETLLSMKLRELQIGCKSADSCIQSFVSDPLETQLGFWLLLIPEIPEKLGSAWDGKR